MSVRRDHPTGVLGFLEYTEKKSGWKWDPLKKTKSRPTMIPSFGISSDKVKSKPPKPESPRSNELEILIEKASVQVLSPSENHILENSYLNNSSKEIKSYKHAIHKRTYKTLSTAQRELISSQEFKLSTYKLKFRKSSKKMFVPLSDSLTLNNPWREPVEFNFPTSTETTNKILMSIHPSSGTVPKGKSQEVKVSLVHFSAEPFIKLIPVEIEVSKKKEDGNRVTYRDRLYFLVTSKVETISDMDHWEFNIEDLQFVKQIGSGANGGVYLYKLWGMDVAVKQWEFGRDDHHPKDYLQEKKAIKLLKHPNIVKMFGSCERTGTSYIMSEFCNHGNLQEVLISSEGQALGLLGRIKLACDCALGMKYLHDSGQIHRDLKSLNVMVSSNGKELRAKVGDFGESRQQVDKTMTQAVGTLLWMAPEVFNSRQYSYSADVYSYGIILWETLCCAHPNRQLADISNGIFNLPYPSHVPEKDERAVKMIFDLIQWCCDPNPLKRPTFKDILQSLSDIRATALQPFSIPSRLYGREDELKMVLQYLYPPRNSGNMSVPGSLSNGRNSFTVLHGEAGIGKSAFLASLQSHCLQRKDSISFFFGRYESRDKPLGGIIQALKKPINEILVLSPTELQQRKKRLMDVVHPFAPIINSIVPDAQMLLGKSQSDKHIDIDDEQRRRIHESFARFICELSNKPTLVICLDDIHTSSTCTIDLMKCMVLMKLPRTVHVIISYRDQEVGVDHPLRERIQYLEDYGNNILKKVNLRPLKIDNIKSLVADTCRLTDDAVATPFADLIMKKSHGNPFFVTQFLMAAHNEGLIGFDIESDSWRWEKIAKIEEKMVITDSVADLLLLNINKLDNTVQNLLKVASCVGFVFDLATVDCVLATLQVLDNSPTPLPISKSVVHHPPTSCLSLIKQATSNHIIGLANAGDSNISWSRSTFYRFLHNRIFEAVESMVSPEEKKKIHTIVGYHILWTLESEEMNDKIFVVIDHLNFMLPDVSKLSIETLIDSSQFTLNLEEEECYKLLHLNRLAAKQSTKNLAFDTALNFYKLTILLLNTLYPPKVGGPWKHDPLQTFELYKAYAECAFTTLNHEETRIITNKLLDKEFHKGTLSVMQISEVKLLIVQLLNKHSEYNHTYKVGSEALETLGFPLIQHTPENLEQLYNEIMLALGNSDVEQRFLYAPEITDPNSKMIMLFLYHIFPTMFCDNHDAQFFLACTTVKYMISTKGNFGAYSAFSLAIFAAYLILRKNDPVRSLRICNVANQLVTKFELDSLVNSRTHFFLSLNYTLTSSLQRAIQSMEHASKDAVARSDWQFAAWCTDCQLCYSLYSGHEPLPESYKKYNLHRNWFVKLNNEEFNLLMQVNDLLMASFFDEREEGILDRDDESKPLIDRMRQLKGNACKIKFLIRILLKRLVLGQFAEAAELVTEFHAPCSCDAIHMPVHRFEFQFYCGLALTGNYHYVSTATQEQYKSILREIGQQTAAYASTSPQNFRAKQLFIESEILRVDGQLSQSIRQLQMAIIAAREDGLVSVCALASERASLVFQELNLQDINLHHLNEALKYYHAWGVASKVRDLMSRSYYLTNSNSFYSSSASSSPSSSPFSSTSSFSSFSLSGSSLNNSFNGSSSIPSINIGSPTGERNRDSLNALQRSPSGSSLNSMSAAFFIPQSRVVVKELVQLFVPLVNSLGRRNELFEHVVRLVFNMCRAKKVALVVARSAFFGLDEDEDHAHSLEEEALDNLVVVVEARSNSVSSARFNNVSPTSTLSSSSSSASSSTSSSNSSSLSLSNPQLTSPNSSPPVSNYLNSLNFPVDDDQSFSDSPSNSGFIEVTQSLTPLEKHHSLPREIIRFTARVQNPVRYTSAEGKNSENGIEEQSYSFTANDFKNDEFLRVQKPLSVLCLPLVQDEVFLGELYLENQNNSDVFHPKRVNMLENLLPFVSSVLRQSGLMDGKDHSKPIFKCTDD